jgi:hypothetical protein
MEPSCFNHRLIQSIKFQEDKMGKYEKPIFRLIGFALIILPWACAAIVAHFVVY